MFTYPSQQPPLNWDDSGGLNSSLLEQESRKRAQWFITSICMGLIGLPLIFMLECQIRFNTDVVMLITLVPLNESLETLY